MGKGLSPMQREILRALRRFPMSLAEGERMSARDMASTGDVIDALGRLRTPSNFASISRALSSLTKRNLVRGYSAFGHLQGKGWRYCLPRETIEDAQVLVE